MSFPKLPYFSGYLLGAWLLLARPAEARNPFEFFQEARPLFKPERYFAGHTRSWGIFERRSGEPRQIITTETWGRWTGDIFKFEQNLQIGHGKKSHRTWSIRRADEHHYTATGTGIIGTARGEVHGNAFHLEFTLDALPGNPLAHLHMSQWMYLQADGVTMLNRAVLSKAGVIVTEITETFRKEQ